MKPKLFFVLVIIFVLSYIPAIAIQYDLKQVIDNESIELKITGTNSNVGLNVEFANQISEPLEIIIPQGAVFVEQNGYYQNMVVAKSTIVTLIAFETKKVYVYALCMDPEKDPPYSSDSVLAPFMDSYDYKLSSQPLAKEIVFLLDAATQIDDEIALLSKKIKILGVSKRDDIIIDLMKETNAADEDELSRLLEAVGIQLKDITDIYHIQLQSDVSFAENTLADYAEWFVNGNKAVLINSSVLPKLSPVPPNQEEIQISGRLQTNILQFAIWMASTNDYTKSTLEGRVKKFMPSSLNTEIKEYIENLWNGIQFLFRKAGLTDRLTNN